MTTSQVALDVDIYETRTGNFVGYFSSLNKAVRELCPDQLKYDHRTGKPYSLNAVHCAKVLTRSGYTGQAPTPRKTRQATLVVDQPLSLPYTQPRLLLEYKPEGGQA